MNNMMTLSQALPWLEGARLVGTGDVAFARVHTDTRTIEPGDLFVALRGERFDANDFLKEAKAKGAVAAICQGEQAAARLQEAGLSGLVVMDAKLALAALATGWRAQFKLPLIAVTGSNGKTTVTQMIAAILRAYKPQACLATQGNLNNDIGLPLTLLKLNANHRAAIIEMGMNHPGEIAYLTRIARPTVAVVTNAQRAHLAGMGTLETIATEKGSVFMGLSKPGVAVINVDDDWADLWRAQAANRDVMTFSFEQPADVSGSFQGHGLENQLSISAKGETVLVALALPGAHNARNALGAATAALAAGVALSAVRDGLLAFRGIKGRLQRRSGLNGATLLDDTYNANPDSVRAGIDVLAATVGKKILVLGDMGEIGEMTGQFHDEIGGYAKSQGVDMLLAFGESSALAAHNFGAGGQHFKKIENLIEVLSNELTTETTVLIKGSRFMRMERVADAVSAPVTEGSK